MVNKNTFSSRDMTGYSNATGADIKTQLTGALATVTDLQKKLSDAQTLLAGLNADWTANNQSLKDYSTPPTSAADMPSWQATVTRIQNYLGNLTVKINAAKSNIEGLSKSLTSAQTTYDRLVASAGAAMEASLTPAEKAQAQQVQAQTQILVDKAKSQQKASQVWLYVGAGLVIIGVIGFIIYKVKKK